MRATRVLVPLALLAAGFAAAWLLRPRLSAQAPGGSLVSAVVRADEAIPSPWEWGEWRRYFRGDTHGTRDMIVLLVTLKPGQAPHPPHQHAEEELMVLAKGSGTWSLDGKQVAARAGDVLYAAPWTLHGLKNTGDVPLDYYMVKWSGKAVRAPEAPAGGGVEPRAAEKGERLPGE